MELPDEPSTPAHELFGYAVHHALHARVAIERRRYWQAEYWISAVRDHALALACRRRGLDGWYGRDFDRLPSEVMYPANDALVRSLERGELLRALEHAVGALLRESAEVGEMAEKVEDQVRALASEHVNDVEPRMNITFELVYDDRRRLLPFLLLADESEPIVGS